MGLKRLNKWCMLEADSAP